MDRCRARGKTFPSAGSGNLIHCPGCRKTFERQKPKCKSLRAGRLPARNDACYCAPGIDIPGRSFTLENGQSYYVIIDGYIVESTTEDFQAGTHFPLMFTFDYVEGRVEQELVAWTQDADGDWFPFLNEGLMMTNVRRVR